MDREQLERIVTSVPKFRSRWDSFLSEWEPDGEPPWYIGMNQLAHYVVDCQSQNSTSELPNLFATKIQRAKHWVVADLDRQFNCVIAGAGSEDSLRLAIQTWLATLIQQHADRPKVTIVELTNALRSALQYVHTQHIHPEFGMIIGLRPQTKTQCYLRL